ncbi:MAG TPA: acyltransferase [Dinghuibacter sp.]|jgi:peptidoglycan/LPS O-acetylase OafA/YrhL|uniref:acyltransferase family protein n=1 Tax=Dinghuibacter sp. TaxID=2024697 RepID=UPI002BCAA5C2|nr:acyltransferase [Dinghuibacter sp.]HTJ14758.1 acyltransferase [Dinghuibacter sp.]
MIKSIQLARALAALSVVFYHYHLYGFNIGDFGVDIFFVISGFIIAYMVNKTTDRFALKRIVRVAPLYYIATCITIVLALLRPSMFKSVVVTGGAIVKSFLFIPYAIKDSGPILSLGWTLNYEMFFYLAMFLCILFFRDKKRNLVPACGGVLILFLGILTATGTDSFILLFYKNGQLPEFIYGLGLYYVMTYYKSKRIASADYLMTALGFFALVFMVYAQATGRFTGLSRNIRLGIPSLLFVNGLLALENKINQDNHLIKWGLKLGDASYAMYLFHPFIIFALLRLVYPKLGHNGSLLLNLAEVVVALAAVCLCSVWLYDYLDKPINDLLKRRKTPGSPSSHKPLPSYGG